MKCVVCSGTGDRFILGDKGCSICLGSGEVCEDCGNPCAEGAEYCERCEESGDHDPLLRNYELTEREPVEAFHDFTDEDQS